MKINTLTQAYHQVISDWNTRKIESQEQVYCIFLNRDNTVIDCQTIFSGTKHKCLFDVKIILKEAIALQADGIIIAHNHPDGDRRVSKEDIFTTKKLCDACVVMDIKLYDHLIIVNGAFSSVERFCEDTGVEHRMQGLIS